MTESADWMKNKMLKSPIISRRLIQWYKPRFSTIIPSYNDELSIRNSLNKLFQYLVKIEIKDKEILVLIKVSIDRIFEIVKQFKRARVNIYPQSIGKGGSIRVGVSLSIKRKKNIKFPIRWQYELFSTFSLRCILALYFSMLRFLLVVLFMDDENELRYLEVEPSL